MVKWMIKLEKKLMHFQNNSTNLFFKVMMEDQHLKISQQSRNGRISRALLKRTPRISNHCMLISTPFQTSSGKRAKLQRIHSPFHVARAIQAFDQTHPSMKSLSKLIKIDQKRQSSNQSTLSPEIIKKSLKLKTGDIYKQIKKLHFTYDKKRLEKFKQALLKIGHKKISQCFLNKSMKYNIQQMIAVILLATLVQMISSTVLTLSGGELTINGAITSSYMDLFMNLTANVQWVAIIWSQNEADTDVTLFKANPSNPAYPVTLVDCYLDQNSAIQTDNIQNLMTSVTGYSGDISNGISAAFKRDLVTGDTQDIIIYGNSVIQICVICSLLPFVGGGQQTGNQKDCSYLSLHQNVNYLYDRLLGNYAGTTTFGGGNLTVYATQSTDGYALQSFLFLSVVHKAQGLNPFSPKYLGVLYSDTLTNNDMAIIQYNTVGVSLDIHINDYFSVSATSAAPDMSYTTGQGSDDVVTVLTAYDASSYMVGSFKRKFSTGDINRDIILSDGDSRYCIIYGNSLVFTTFAQADKFCFNFTLATEYTSLFRQTSSTSVPVQTYTPPQSQVAVVSPSASSSLQMNLLIQSTCILFLIMIFY